MGSTRRCGRSRRSAASRSSSPGPRAPYLVDTDGRRYLDYVQSWGASILGHAHPDGRRGGAARRGRRHVVRRADRARGRAGRGDRRAGAVGREGAPRVVGHRGGHDRGPPRPRRHRPRRRSSSSPAATTATSTPCSSRPAAASPPSACPARPASPTGAVADTVVVPYNDDAALDDAFDRYGAELAAVIVEPVAANMGLVPPADGFLDGLRRRCTDAGALLDLRRGDHRVPPRARRRAGPLRRHARPVDASARWSAAGSRSPRSAAGPRSWTSSRRSAPCTRPAPCPGTRSPPPPVSPCSRSSTTTPTPTLDATATRFADGLAPRPLPARPGHAGRDPHRPVLRRRTRSPTTTAAQARRPRGATPGLFHDLLDRGVFLAPSGYETLFVSLAHTDELIDQTVEIAAARS